MDPREAAIDIVNRTPADQLCTLENDARLDCLPLHSGLFRYTADPRAELRAVLQAEANGASYPANPDPAGDRAYWQALADRVTRR